VDIPVSNRLKRIALTTWAAIGVLILLVALVWIMGQVRVIWLPLVFAFGITVLLDPIARVFQRISLPRVVAVILAFGILALALIGIGSILVPLVQEQANQFGSSLPDLYDQALIWVIDNAGRLGINVDSVLTAESIQEWLQDPANQETISGFLDGFGTGAGLVLRGVAEIVSVVVLSPLFAFYLLVDLDRMKRLMVDLTPHRLKDEVRFVGANLGAALGGFVRGQLVVAIIVGFLSSLALLLLEVPFWLIIGLAAGLLNLIPFVGPFVGGALAVMVALLEGRPTTALIAAAAFLGIQQLDNHLITPLVQRARVKLSPLVIVLALLVGGAVGGLLGVLVAVPSVAAIRIVLGHLWRTRILGESWSEASEAMIEVSGPPERLIRRKGDQARLFDTSEMEPVPAEPGPLAHE
jgi:predicted PurR-regulated permease PerM